jgi:REP element-mobilizing transposase RayT
VARQPRILIAGGTYHVTARGNRRQPIFVDDFDRRLFLRLVADAATLFRWQCGAYCLLSNHFHLLVETPREPSDLPMGMHRLNSRYARWVNERYGLDGHLFQGRFGSVLIESDGHLLGTVRYIARNPVEAGLCATPEDWRWSSYAALLGRVPLPPFLKQDLALDFFANDRRRALELFAGFVAGGP